MHDDEEAIVESAETDEESPLDGALLAWALAVDRGLLDLACQHAHDVLDLITCDECPWPSRRLRRGVFLRWCRQMELVK